MNKNNKLTALKLAISIMLVMMLAAVIALADPVGPRLTYVTNSTTSNTGGTLRNDSGGYIHTLRLNVTQQNYGWKAYVGNVTGTLALEDQSNFSIYEWPLGGTEWEVYISRAGSNIAWSSVNCSNRTVIQAEDTALNINSSTTDSVNLTFNSTPNHKSFVVAGTTIANGTCPAIATYVNDTAQTVNQSAKFQEILLADSGSNLIYASLVDNDALSYDGSATYDFQAIIADDETTGVNTAYYFYVELA